MSQYAVEFLTTNRSGGLVDKCSIVKAHSADEARAIVQARHPNAAIGYVGTP